MRILTSIAVILIVFTAGLKAQIRLNGGNPVLSITTGFGGSQPIAVTNTSTRVRFRRQNFISKVTVSTRCPGQRFNLRVEAISPTDGVAAPPVTLRDSQPATDFITDIPKAPPTNNRTATLEYTASATFAQGNSAELGNDVHRVTCTLTAQ